MIKRIKSTSELKKKLITKISVLNDEKMLQEVYRLLEMGDSNFKPYKLSNEQITVVNESKKDVRKGNFLTNKEAEKEVLTWAKGQDNKMCRTKNKLSNDEIVAIVKENRLHAKK